MVYKHLVTLLLLTVPSLVAQHTCGKGDIPTTQPPIKPDNNCYIGRADSYRGTVHHTVGGLECQRWDSQSPHPHKHNKTSYFTDGVLPENYCRTFVGRSYRPLCHTTDPHTKWDFCDVKPCAAIQKIQLPTKPTVQCMHMGLCYNHGETGMRGCFEYRCNVTGDTHWGWNLSRAGCEIKGNCVWEGETAKDGCNTQRCDKKTKNDRVFTKPVFVTTNCEYRGQCIPHGQCVPYHGNSLHCDMKKTSSGDLTGFIKYKWEKCASAQS